MLRSGEETENGREENQFFNSYILRLTIRSTDISFPLALKCCSSFPSALLIEFSRRGKIGDRAQYFSHELTIEG